MARPRGDLDKVLEWAVGRGLVLLGKRAFSRGDYHEYRHYLAAVRGGNSEACSEHNCVLDPVIVVPDRVY